MKKTLFTILLSGVLFSGLAYAERMHIEAGTTYDYTSSNGRFTIRATAQTDFGGVWSMKLLEGDKEISQTSFFDYPGTLAVSDQGNMMASTDPTSHAEFGSESVSIYDASWKRLKQIPYGDPSETDVIALKIVKVLSLSSDGSYCAIGEDSSEGAGIALFDVKEGKKLWDKSLGLPAIREIVFAPQGGNFLVATSEHESFDMLIQLVDRAGKVLWEKRVPKNFSSYDVKYVRFKEDGKKIEIFHTDQNAYLTEALPSV